MKPALHPDQQIKSVKTMIRRIISSHENSVSSIISEATKNCQTLEGCLQLIVSECERKQTDLQTLTETSLMLVQNYLNLWREQECLIGKNLEKDQILERTQQENNKLAQKNENIKEELKQALDQVFRSEQIFQRQKKMLKEEINEQISNYVQQMSQSEENKFKQLAQHIKELEQEVFCLQDQIQAGKSVISSLLMKNKEQVEQRKLIETQYQSLEKKYTELNIEYEKLKDDNQILCRQIKQFYSKKSSSTNELGSVGSCGYLHECYIPLTKDQNQLENNEQSLIYRVKSYDKISSMSSLMNLGDLNFDNDRKTVSIGIQTQETGGVPFLNLSKIGSPCASDRPMLNSAVFERLNTGDIQGRMNKKNKADVVQISQQVCATERSFVSSLVARRTHKNKLNMSLQEYEQKNSKSSISFLTNNNLTEKLVSSRIRKKNQRVSESYCAQKKNPSFMDSLCNLVVKNRIKK